MFLGAFADPLGFEDQPLQVTACQRAGTVLQASSDCNHGSLCMQSVPCSLLRLWALATTLESLFG
jgi:hypothetical protein